MKHIDTKRGTRRLRAAIAGTVLLSAAGGATAVPVETDLNYHCYYEIIGWQPMSVNIKSDMPESIPPGQLTPQFNIESTSTVKGQTWLGLASILRATSLEGHGDFGASAASHVGGPNFDFPLFVDMTIPRNEIPSSDPGPEGFELTGIAGSTPPIMFREENIGEMVIRVKDTVNDEGGYTFEELDGVLPENVAETDLELEIIARRGEDVLIQPPITDAEGVIRSKCVLEPGQEDAQILHTFMVDGGETDPDIAVDPEAHDFGQVQIGDTSAQDIQVTNPGGGLLTVSSVDLAGDADFTQTHDCDTVEPGSECTISVTFTPGEEGDRSAELTINSDAPEAEAITVALQGQGALAPTPDIAVTPAEVDFGQVQAGEQSVQDVQITNPGAASLQITAVEIAGDTEFTQSNDCATVDPGGDDLCTVSVTFMPGGEGTMAADLMISSDAPEKESITVPLQGQGMLAPAPDIAVAPMDIDFGGVEVGTQAQETVTVSNGGNADLVIQDYALSGEGQDAFNVTSECDTLAADAECTITVTFNPTEEGVKSATLSVVSNDEDSPSRVTLTGQGTVQALPVIAISDDELAFGSVQAGGSKDLELTVTNNGTADLNVGNIHIEGSHADEFSADSQCAALAPEASCTVLVTFASSQEEGNKAASLVIASDDPSSPEVNVSLTGQTTALPSPNLVLSNTELDLGEVVVGEQAQASVSLSNEGTGELNFTAIAIEGDGFSQTNDCGDILAAEASCNATVTFEPADAGDFTATLSVESDDPDQATQVVNVSARGTLAAAPNLQVEPTSVAFGATLIDDTRTEEVQLRNTGSAALAIDGIAISGDSAAFSQSNDCQVIQAGETCPVTVAFQPTSQGQFNAELTVQSNDPDSASLNIPLSGEGTMTAVGEISITPTLVDFGPVAPGNTGNKELVIKNTGTADLSLSLSLDGENGDLFTQRDDQSQCGALRPGDVCTVKLSFKPDTEGGKSASLTITSDQLEQPVEVPLVGHGHNDVVNEVIVEKKDGGSWGPLLLLALGLLAWRRFPGRRADKK